MFTAPLEPAGPIRTDDPIGLLNSVQFGPAQIEAALGVLATLPGHQSGSPLAQAAALQAHAQACSRGCDPLCGAALHARVTALAKWTARHDRERLSDAAAVMEATARYPLSDLPDGVEFEPSGFRETIEFIADLPW